jgi:pimeloyl-ACP methyl ester carboxylesterase
MTDHYFENDLVKLHYYKFGSGPQAMLCFHGYGMHGKQFKILASNLGLKYTFYGFDLFFHKETLLNDQSLTAVKKGISKAELAALIVDFCQSQNIQKISVIGYSMGTHFATVVVEELAPMIDEYIVLAPSSLYPGRLVPFFSKNKTGNKILEKMVLHEKALIRLLKLFKFVRIIDNEAYNILQSEFGTVQLRFNFYACITYLRFFETNQQRLFDALERQNIKSIFIFGKRDKSFPPGIGKNFIGRLTKPQVVVLNEGHDMVKKSLVIALTKLLL